MSHSSLDRFIGILLVAITCVVALREWGVAGWPHTVSSGLVLVVVGLLAVQVRMSRKAFIAIAAALTGALALRDPAWAAVALRGLGASAFIAAFFCALSTLRNVAQTSDAILRAGRFLSGQRPGRRYAALTLGGEAFALVLNYGAIQLLGTLAMANAGSEPNPEIRGHRIRRMLLAIQRGFVSTLPWSPMSFAIAISTSVIPGTSWGEVLVPGLITSVILGGTGWALDTIFKPRLTVVPSRSEPEGGWRTLLPLLLLLSVLGGSVAILHMWNGMRVAGLVMVVVPLLSVVWLWLQNRADAPLRAVNRRVAAFVSAELPGYRGELTLLMMAGYIGTVGAQLLVPMIAAAGFDIGGLPPLVILVAFVWLIPLAGQLGMNPILAVTLIAPLIPDAAAIGVSPSAIVVAITAGWALSGASSPFTATTLLIGSFAGISAHRVGLRWNGAYTLICGGLLSCWVALYAVLA